MQREVRLDAFDQLLVTDDAELGAAGRLREHVAAGQKVTAGRGADLGARVHVRVVADAIVEGRGSHGRRRCGGARGYEPEERGPQHLRRRRRQRADVVERQRRAALRRDAVEVERGRGLRGELMVQVVEDQRLAVAHEREQVALGQLLSAAASKLLGAVGVGQEQLVPREQRVLRVGRVALLDVALERQPLGQAREERLQVRASVCAQRRKLLKVVPRRLRTPSHGVAHAVAGEQERNVREEDRPQARVLLALGGREAKETRWWLGGALEGARVHDEVAIAAAERVVHSHGHGLAQDGRGETGRRAVGVVGVEVDHEHALLHHRRRRGKGGGRETEEEARGRLDDVGELSRHQRHVHILEAERVHERAQRLAHGREQRGVLGDDDHGRLRRERVHGLDDGAGAEVRKEERKRHIARHVRQRLARDHEALGAERDGDG
eukprot:Unigene1221_Nuclearia_a/m.3886 Unigene1221_Nuclearia_a/g.3886  ORF Unigene1221_Nuclearia_a/g.3886 Unigene1221_Nuclearia_a/m.3886 type:complete len:437 (+) Unigene1221_Nuclearia_a:1993-3303(+)